MFMHIWLLFLSAEEGGRTFFTGTSVSVRTERRGHLLKLPLHSAEKCGILDR